MVGRSGMLAAKWMVAIRPGPKYGESPRDLGAALARRLGNLPHRAHPADLGDAGLDVIDAGGTHELGDVGQRSGVLAGGDRHAAFLLQAGQAGIVLRRP